MPRLSPSLLRYAASRNRHLPRLLRECRDLESASNELRWLAEYAQHNSRVRHANSDTAGACLMHYVHRRARGEPLQYILGNQPFGSLDILCRKKVLIPRPETELYTTTLAALLNRLRGDGVVDMQLPIKVADLCAGTGCIALLLHTLLRFGNADVERRQPLEVLGVDVCPDALGLARQNLQHNLAGGCLHASCNHDISFDFLNVLDLGERARQAVNNGADAPNGLNPTQTRLLTSSWDVIVSNPPYISPTDYAPGGTVTRSVRDYEPKLALVPPALTAAAKKRRLNQADQFYEAVLSIARKAEAKVIVMEIGDPQQARRVRHLTAQVMTSADLIETWRDDSSVDSYGPAQKLQDSARYSAPGSDVAPERAVVVWQGAWADWRLRTIASK